MGNAKNSLQSLVRGMSWGAVPHGRGISTGNLLIKFGGEKGNVGLVPQNGSSRIDFQWEKAERKDSFCWLRDRRCRNSRKRRSRGGKNHVKRESSGGRKKKKKKNKKKERKD